MSTIGKRTNGGSTAATSRQFGRRSKNSSGSDATVRPARPDSNPTLTDNRAQPKYSTPLTTAQNVPSAPKDSPKEIALTLEAWAQSASPASRQAVPSLEAIDRALGSLSLELHANSSKEHYDALVKSLATRGDAMPYAEKARAFLNAHLTERIQQFKDDLVSITPAEAKESQATLKMMRKLPFGSQLAGEFGNLLHNYAVVIGELRSPVTTTTAQSSAPRVFREAYSLAVNAALLEVDGDRSWSVLRAVQASPNVAGVIVGALGSSLGRGSFAKVKPFVFSPGSEVYASGDASTRYVARITRDTADYEKKNLRGGSYRGYGATSVEMAQSEAEALAAVNSELTPVAIFEDDKGRQLEIIRYFDGTLQDLIEQAPALCTNGAFLHNVTRALLGELELFNRAGYVHLDIKPANILFDYARMFAVFGDFGFARKHGFTNFEGGTERFMSPEMQRGEPQKVDTRSDMYSLAYSIMDFSAHQLVKQTPLYQRRRKDLFNDPEFQKQALAAMHPAERKIYNTHPNPEVPIYLLQRAIAALSSKLAADALRQWHVERFGSLGVPLRLAAMEGHHTPLDNLFTHLARADLLVAQFIAAALRGEQSERGSPSRWLSRFQNNHKFLSPAKQREASDIITSLRSGDDASRKSKDLMKLQRFIERVDVERPVIADSDDEEDTAAAARPRGRTGRRR